MPRKVGQCCSPVTPSVPSRLAADRPRAQIKTEASVVQNRESQRRSRERRRDLVDDLKRRLHEYENRDAVATLEMQNAARAVNAENQRLRTLLKMRGVGQVELDQFLAEDDALTPARWNLKQEHDQLNARSIVPHGHDTSAATRYALPDSLSRLPIAHEPMEIHPTRLEPNHRIPMIQLLHESHPAMDRPFSRHVQYEHPESEGTETLGSSASNSSSRETSESRPGGNNSMESSCDAAAAILVDLHKQTDPWSARAALGCTGSNDCSVKNTKIFQLMDGYS